MAIMTLSGPRDLMLLPRQDSVEVSINASTARENDDGTWTVAVRVGEDQIPGLEGLGANGFNGVPVFNADGTRLAFVSTATDLGAPGRSGSPNLYVKDMPNGVTSLVSSGATGDAGNGTSGQARFQPNGSKIVFASSATNLVALDNGPDQDIFLASVAPPSG